MGLCLKWWCLQIFLENIAMGPFNKTFYCTGQPIDGPHNGPAPHAWQMQVTQPALFQPTVIYMEIPHTASVKVEKHFWYFFIKSLPLSLCLFSSTAALEKIWLPGKLYHCFKVPCLHYWFRWQGSCLLSPLKWPQVSSLVTFSIMSVANSFHFLSVSLLLVFWWWWGILLPSLLEPFLKISSQLHMRFQHYHKRVSAARWDEEKWFDQ